MADNTILFPSPDAVLSIEFVMELLADLAEANPGSARSKNLEGMVRVYRKHLAGVSEAAARGAVDALIRGGTRGFPSVGQIREAAHEWNRRNRASPEYQLRHDPNTCQQCRQLYEFQKRWRPAIDEKGLVRITPDRQAILLEAYHRDVCACHAPCDYRPVETEDADAPAQMPIALLREHDQQRVAEQLTRRPSSWRTPPANVAPIADVTPQEVKRLAAGGAR